MPEPDDRFFDRDGNLDVMALWADTVRVVNEAFGPVMWAEEEADKVAAASPPDVADLIYHTIPMMRPPQGMPVVERNIRSHARELATRAAAGGDLRWPTAVEVCCIASAASLRAPFNEEGTGLYGRVFARAFPELESPMAEITAYQEKMHGPQIDDLERTFGRQFANRNPRRRIVDGRGRPLPTITCKGLHHGIEVVCRFAKPAPTTRLVGNRAAAGRKVAVPVAGPAPQPAPPVTGELDEAAQTSLFEIMMAVTGQEARPDA
jgi:hypothetical protein